MLLRKERIHFRVTPEEKAMIQKVAEAKGTTITDFFVKCAEKEEKKIKKNLK